MSSELANGRDDPFGSEMFIHNKETRVNTTTIYETIYKKDSFSKKYTNGTHNLFFAKLTSLDTPAAPLSELTMTDFSSSKLADRTPELIAIPKGTARNVLSHVYEGLFYK